MILLLALLAFADAPLREEPGPDWRDKETRNAAQVQVIDTMINSGLTTEALTAVTAIRAKEGSSPALDLVGARALHANGMLEESELQLEKLVRRHPRNGGAWALLGLVRSDRQDVEGATKALTNAVRINPENPAWLNNLGYLYFSTGDLERAGLMLRRALRVDPASERTRNNLAFVLAAQDKDSDALELFRSTGDEADARYNLGVACERRGDVAAALNQYQAALSQRQHAAATAAIQRLTQGSR